MENTFVPCEVGRLMYIFLGLAALSRPNSLLSSVRLIVSLSGSGKGARLERVNRKKVSLFWAVKSIGRVKSRAAASSLHRSLPSCAGNTGFCKPLCFAKDRGIGKTGRKRYIIELGIKDWLQRKSIRAAYPVFQGDWSATCPFVQEYKVMKNSEI